MQPRVVSTKDNQACSAVVIALRFGTQGPGFEPGLFHKACYMPLHGCFNEAKSFTVNKGQSSDNAPETPDPKEQRVHWSFVAKLQFAANCIRYDVSLAASQWASFCASAGVSHWDALHHLMGCVRQSKFRACISVWKLQWIGWLHWFWLGKQWGTSVCNRAVGMIRQIYRIVEIKNAEGDCAVNCGSRILFCIRNCSQDHLSLQLDTKHQLTTGGWYTRVWRHASKGANTSSVVRECAKHIDIRKHFAHEVMQNRHMRLIRAPTESNWRKSLLRRCRFLCSNAV